MYSRSIVLASKLHCFGQNPMRLCRHYVYVQEKPEIPKHQSNDFERHGDKSQVKQPTQYTVKASIDGDISPVARTARSLVSQSIAFFEEITHMDDVRDCQARVMMIKDLVKESGDKKRDIMKQLNDVRQELQKNHGETCSSLRGTERYVQLIREEHELLKKEKLIQDAFTGADEAERRHFGDLTIAINDLYEKEKIHSNMLRVWALVGTLVASVLTLIGSLLAHIHHSKTFSLVASKVNDNVNETIKTEMSTLQNSMRTINETIKSEMSTMQNNLRLDLKGAMHQQNKMIRRESLATTETKRESWGQYLKRHGSTIYNWMLFRKQ